MKTSPKRWRVLYFHSARCDFDRRHLLTTKRFLRMGTKPSTTSPTPTPSPPSSLQITSPTQTPSPPSSLPTTSTTPTPSPPSSLSTTSPPSSSPTPSSPTHQHNQYHQLSGDVGYVMYSAFGSFYIPSCIMVFVYIKIYFAARFSISKP